MTHNERVMLNVMETMQKIRDDFDDPMLFLDYWMEGDYEACAEWSEFTDVNLLEPKLED